MLVVVQFLAWQTATDAEDVGTELHTHPQVFIEAAFLKVPLKESTEDKKEGSAPRPASAVGYSSGAEAMGDAIMLLGTPFGYPDSNLTTDKFLYAARTGAAQFEPMLTALGSMGGIETLQRLRVQTTAGAAAKLFLDESRLHGSGRSHAGRFAPNTLESEPGVTLEVTPCVTNGGGMMLLNLHQRVQKITGTVNIATVGEVPITTTCESLADVTLHDGELVVLGGMLAEDEGEPSGVPVLRSIPVLGAVFRWSHRTRSEVMVLLRARALPEP